MEIEREDRTRLEAAALGLLHDGERWQLLCRADGELVAEPLGPPITVELLPRRHPGEPGFDALAAWDELRRSPEMGMVQP